MSNWKLKIALIDACNQNCYYCSVKGYFPYSIMNIQNVKRIIYAAKEVFGIEKIIYTGGEPLLTDNLPRLVEDVAQTIFLENLTQVVETNAFDSRALREVVARCHSSVLQFRITIPAADSKTMKNITRIDSLQEVMSSVEFLENKRILVHLHYPLIRDINAKSWQIKDIIEKYEDYNYVSLYFDELICDLRNNLISKDCVVTKDAFELIIKELEFEEVKDNSKICQYKRNKKSIFFVSNSCTYGEEDNHTIYVTPNGLIRKEDFFDDCNQVRIKDYRTEGILSSMQNFKDTYWRDI